MNFEQQSKFNYFTIVDYWSIEIDGVRKSAAYRNSFFLLQLKGEVQQSENKFYSQLSKAIFSDDAISSTL